MQLVTSTVTLSFSEVNQKPNSPEEVNLDLEFEGNANSADYDNNDSYYLDGAN